MALLVVGGVMYVLWIAVLSVLVLLEKVAAIGCLIGGLAGVGRRGRRVVVVGRNVDHRRPRGPTLEPPVSLARKRGPYARRRTPVAFCCHRMLPETVEWATWQVRPQTADMIKTDSTVRVSASMENPMLYSVVMLLLALAASYAIARPIAAALLSLALGTTGGFVTANMGISVFAALGGAFVGMMLARRRRHPPQLEMQSKPKRQSARRPHYGISRA